jgi:hypothetical protein
LELGLVEVAEVVVAALDLVVEVAVGLALLSALERFQLQQALTML